MNPTGPKSDNSREFLNKVQPANLVPMSQEDFDRQRNRKILKWAGAAVAVLAVVSVIIWKTSQPSSARTDYEDAVRFYNSGKYREAIQALDRTIDQKVNLADSYRLRGTIYRIMNDPERAAIDLSKVIELDPEQAENYKVRGMAYRDMGAYQKAIDDFTKLTELQPSAAAYNLRGIVYRDMGNIAKALEDFTRSISTDPSIDNYLQRGMAYEQIGDHRHAIEDFDKVVEMRPDVPYTYRSRAFAREALGDKAGAASDRQKAREIEYPKRTADMKAPAKQEEAPAAPAKK